MSNTPAATPVPASDPAPPAPQPASSGSGLVMVLILLGIAVYASQKQDNPVNPSPSGAKLHVLFIEETSDRGSLSDGQLAVLTATGPGSVQAYCDANAAKEADGKTPAWKRLDKDDDVTLLGPFYKAAFEHEKAKPTPRYIATDGTRSISQKIGTPETVLTELKKLRGE